jgi:hypothetical protein
MDIVSEARLARRLTEELITLEGRITALYNNAEPAMP